MGLPEGRSLGQNGQYMLDYRRAVLNEQTGKVFDWSLYITFIFNQGKCISIDIQYSDKPLQLLEEGQLRPGEINKVFYLLKINYWLSGQLKFHLHLG